MAKKTKYQPVVNERVVVSLFQSLMTQQSTESVKEKHNSFKISIITRSLLSSASPPTCLLQFRIFFFKTIFMSGSNKTLAKNAFTRLVGVKASLT